MTAAIELNYMRKAAATVAIALATGLTMTGCKGISTAEERQAHIESKAVGEMFQSQRPYLEPLTADSGLEVFLQFAMLNHPQVEAAYYDWAASVERITVERSLPDPKLTFQAYIQNVLTSLMPGLMMDFPGPGKLGARAAVASAESRAKYFQFESSVLQTAFAVKKAYYPLHFLTEKIRVNRQTLALLANLEKLARSQNEVGKATLQDVLRAQIEEERLRTEIANLEDSRRLLTAQFKATLGLTANEADPPLPQKFEFTRMKLSDEELFATALARNPRLKAMEAEIRLAEANLQLAHKNKAPDFSAGLQAEVYTPPFYWPQASMTLPIWRDKIAAGIAAAHNNQRAAQARLSAEQIVLAVDFAEKTFMIREANRQLELLRERLLPRARQSLEVSRGAYRSGQVDFLNVIDAQRTLLGMQLEEIAMQTQREVSLAELALIIAGQAPTDAPLMKTQPAITKPSR